MNLSFPAGHEIFTVVVDDANGMRVRNLISMGTIANHSPQVEKDGRQKIAVSWDGKDDAGKPVTAGRYKIRGISMPRAKATLDYTWYNPGNPPWEGYPTSGWGANHTGPTGVACAYDKPEAPIQTMVSAQITEGGSAVFGLNAKLDKIYSFVRTGAGSTDVEYYGGDYYMSLTWHNVIMKVTAAGEKSNGFQRPAGVVHEIKLEGTGTDLAVSAGKIAVKITPPDGAKEKHKIVFLEREGGKKQAEVDLTDENLHVHSPVYLEFDPQENLYVSMPSGFYVIAEDGTRKKVTPEGLGKAGPFHIDARGRFYIMDMGPDRQIKVYDPSFKPLYTVGTKGGQQGLEYDKAATQMATRGIATDAAGNLWTTENDHPRRQVLWDSNGKFVRHFVGNTGYGAAHMAGHEQDEKIATGFGMLYNIDPTQAKTGEPWRFLTSGPKKDSPFLIHPSSAGFTRGTLYRSNASGKMREYYLECHPDILEGTLQIFVEKDGDYRPVAAFQNAGGKIPGFPTAPAGSTQIWTDANADELIQATEVLTVPNPAPPGKAWLGGGNFWGWNALMLEDFTIALGGKIFKPARFTEDGAPVYDPATATPMQSQLDNSYPMGWTKVGKHFVGMRHGETVFHGHHVVVDQKGKLVSQFPFDGLTVQGSMKTPMPPPGKTTGEVVIAGSVNLGPEIGSVYAWHGNYGQAFVFTEDGLFLTSLFKDVRDNPAGPGETLVKGADWTGVTMQQESFGCWFGKQNDGKIRYLFGQNAALVTEIHNLEKAARFDAGWVDWTPPAPPKP
ncbi:MAG: hypothetical protein SFY92_10085 [Verrucomicrobiae bacterium]|nr:hypothetical protein [Verrucomicrobiae bacterium]